MTHEQFTDGLFPVANHQAQSAGDNFVISPEMAQEMMNDDDLLRDLQNILNDPDSAENAAIGRILESEGASLNDIREVTSGGFTPEGRTPANPNVRPLTIKGKQELREIEDGIEGLKKRIQELKDEKVKIDNEIKKLRKEGADEKKIQQKKNLRDRVGKYLKNKEATKESLEKKLEDLKDGDKEKPPTPFTGKIDAPSKDFIDYFPYTVPTAVIIALLAYLLTRPKPATVPVRKH